MMSCPGEELLAAHLDGETTTSAADAFVAHLQSCAACRTRHAHLERLSRALREARPKLEDERFAPEISARLRALPARRVRGHVPALAAVATAVAALLLFVVARPGPSDAPELVARGAVPESTRRLGLEVRGHKPGHADPVVLADGSRLPLEAGFSFTVFNRTDESWYLMAFGIDANESVHWFYPAYLEAGTNPTSVPVPSTPAMQPLADGVTPEYPAPGRFVVAALFTPTPLHVETVELLLAAGGLKKVAEYLPDGRLQQWSIELVAR